MIVLRSERLALRELEPDDAEFILELLNEPAFLRFIGDKGVRTLADARQYLEQGPIDSYRRHGFGLYLASLPRRNAHRDLRAGEARRSRGRGRGVRVPGAYWSRATPPESALAVLATAGA